MSRSTDTDSPSSRRRQTARDIAFSVLVGGGLTAAFIVPALVLTREGDELRDCARDFGASQSLVRQVRDDPLMGLAYGADRGWYVTGVAEENSGATGDVWVWSELDAVDCEAPFD